ncbi:MAG: DUF3426 domain-containing protein [Dehalococcoidia bacterium]|nr:DUF3426 domain-containing protein [Dehalococcoidia bacterium]
MRKIIVTVVLSLLLVAYAVGIIVAIVAFSRSIPEPDPGSIDDISIRSSWVPGSDGLLWLRLDITNNGDKAIRDIQGVFHYTDYGHNDTVVNSYYWPSPAGTTLYVYDAFGQSIYEKSKPRIEPGEMLSLVIHKIPGEWISYVYEVRGYITWIDFGPGNSWGTKDLKASEISEAEVFKVEVAPIFSGVAN